MERIPVREFGKYVLYALVEKGGMAEVYFGLSESPIPGEFARFVAVKKALPHISQNKIIVTNLIQEAKIGVLLEHPNIAEVYDLGTVGGEFFIAMAFVQGKDLTRVTEVLKSKGRRLDDPLAYFITYQVLSGLHSAHTLRDVHGELLNIVHRDVSPGNILCSYRGEVKIVDFGVATSEIHREEQIPMFAAGKLFYMAPEQLTGKPATSRSDLYSTGVVLFEMLTGKRPFDAPNMDAFRQKMETGDRVRLQDLRPDLPEPIVSLLDKALERDPELRFDSAATFARQLNDVYKAAGGEDLRIASHRKALRDKLSALLYDVFSDAIGAEIFLNQEALNDYRHRRDRVGVNTIAQAAAPMVAASSVVGGETVYSPDVGNDATRALYLDAQQRAALLDDVRGSMNGESEVEMVTSEFDWLSVSPFEESTNSLSERQLQLEEKISELSIPSDVRTQIQGLVSASKKIESENPLESSRAVFDGAEPGAQTLRRDSGAKVAETVIRTPNELGEKEMSVYSLSGEISEPSSLISEISSTPQPLAATVLKPPGDAKPTVETVLDSGQPVPVEAIATQTDLSSEAAKADAPDDLPRWSGRSSYAMRIAQEVRDKERASFHRSQGVYDQVMRVLEKASVQAIIIAVFGMGLVSLAAVLFIRLWLAPQVTPVPKLLPPFPKTIGIAMIIEEKPTSGRALFEDLQTGSEALRHIEALFASEYYRITKKTGTPIRLISVGPFRSPKRLSSPSMILDILGGYSLIDLFQSAVRKQSELFKSFEATIFVYFYPVHLSGEQMVTFPVEYGKRRENGIGIVYFSMARGDFGEGVFSIAHEIGHLFGATDKYDVMNGRPLPWGLVDPERGDQQEKAELMARSLSISAREIRPVKNLDVVGIGAATARELGWIK